MTDSPERQRRFPRIQSENALLVRWLSKESGEGFAKTRVVGLGGCMFESDESLGVGSGIEILISVRGRVAKLPGRVAWELEKEPSRFEVGIEFTDVESPDREVIAGLFDPAEIGTAERPV